MNHHRRVLLAVVADVERAEAARQGQVDLQRAALPVTPDCVGQDEFQFRAVEGAFPLGERTGDLKAVFTPTGEGEWDVAFHFDWEDGPHVYKGTAKGDITAGEFGGEVENDNPERQATFRFRGSFEDGKFLGTHGSLQKDGTLRDTGTMSLTRK